MQNGRVLTILGPGSSQVQPSPSSLERQRQLGPAALCQPPKRLASSSCSLSSWTWRTNPLTLCPTETLATQCLHCKWAPFSVFGQLLDSLPSTQDQRHTSPSIIQAQDHKSIFFGAYSPGPSGGTSRADQTLPHGQPACSTP